MRQVDLISILHTHPELKHFHEFIITMLYAMAKFWPFHNAAQTLEIPDLFKPRNHPPLPLLPSSEPPHFFSILPFLFSPSLGLCVLLTWRPSSSCSYPLTFPVLQCLTHSGDPVNKWMIPSCPETSLYHSGV